ncbi:MAG: hypothetical protein GY862_19555 [Gammaproteobacteria bacterium]|nr:hypothetical protein [Gammaproteobacteria bacterium]
MKLILKQYLSSLRERDELDVILPDLLSQLGLNVYSRPGRGTLQRGVDVGAVGSLNGEPEKVYLFSIKAGDLTRRDWDGDSEQSLRPSLNEIIDAYIPNRLPVEHSEKNIVICICFGGDIQEQVREQIKGFIAQNKTTKVSFKEWNGDKLADLIQSSFLREDLLPAHARSRLRKSLALLDEPEASYKHFAALIKSLSDVSALKDSQRITAIRQMSICLWVLFAWARDAENMESAYLSSELTLLHGWNIVKLYADQKKKAAQAVNDGFSSIFSAYQQICTEFHSFNILPHVDKLHALSDAVYASCSLDINLKLFDLLGRLALAGIWAYCRAHRCSDEEAKIKEQMLQKTRKYMSSVKALILNNPALLLPVKDDQAIDIFIAAFLLALDINNHADIRNWLAETLRRAMFAYQVNGRYPCILSSYSELLLHPKSDENKYRENVTNGSILYPVIALWAALLGDEDAYNNVGHFKEQHLQHCNFQLWYPDDGSEEHFYTNSDFHGAVLSSVSVDRPKEEFLAQIFGECDQSSHFNDLSAIKFNWWPLIIVACRHYRLPPPLHFLEGFKLSLNDHIKQA